MRIDKKEIILKEAVRLFGVHGFYKTTTAQIARAAGVTQPYIFHFFDSKEHLFNAVLDCAAIRIKKAFEASVGNHSSIIGKMGHSFQMIMSEHRDEILMVMQAYTIAEPVIREHVAQIYKDIQNAIVNILIKADIPDPYIETAKFMATGHYLVVMEVLGTENMFSIKNG